MCAQATFYFLLSTFYYFFKIFIFKSVHKNLSFIVSPCGGAALVFFLDTVTLVEHLLTSGKGDVQFGVTVLIDPHTCRDDGHAAVIEFRLQLLQFLTVKKEFTVTLGFVVVVTPVGVLTDVDVVRPQFAIDERTIGIREVDLAGAYGLDFSAGEDNACRKGSDEDIFKLRLPVLDIDFGGRFLGHD